jgi:hypothetical protein
MIPARNNIPVYYIISIGESVFYGYLFYRLSQKRLLKNFIKIFSWSLLLVYAYGLIAYTNDSTYYISLADHQRIFSWRWFLYCISMNVSTAMMSRPE